jgi:Domain of unknown function (DUF4276)
MTEVTQVVAVVEGQTEEALFVRVLAPFLATRQIYITPIVVETSRAAGGHKFKGGGKWSHYRRDLARLLAEPQWAAVTTMIDFYGYPGDAPGADCDRPHDPRACVMFREEAMSSDLEHAARFLPFVMLHELETLVFSAALGRPAVLGSNEVATALAREAAEVDGDVELLNDDPITAPSKRVARVWPDYQKVTDGVAVIEEAGLAHVLERCPHFADWVNAILALSTPHDA